MSKKLPINIAARNAFWVYDALVAPRFAGAPSILESKRSHEIPDFDTLPEGANVAVEMYGGAFTLRLDGELRRVYVRRFEYASFTSERDVRHAFLTLWREVEALESAAEVGRVAGEWLERWRQK